MAYNDCISTALYGFFFKVFDGKYTAKNLRKRLTATDVLHTHLAYIKQDLQDGVFVAVWEIEYGIGSVLHD